MFLAILDERSRIKIMAIEICQTLGSSVGLEHQTVIGNLRVAGSTPAPEMVFCWCLFSFFPFTPCKTAFNSSHLVGIVI